jgi:hypothetical protein
MLDGLLATHSRSGGLSTVTKSWKYEALKSINTHGTWQIHEPHLYHIASQLGIMEGRASKDDVVGLLEDRIGRSLVGLPIAFFRGFGH